MKEAIEKFCNNHDNGLFLIDMPTGWGKTYNVLEFIADNYNKKEYKKTNFFFITNYKKNLPYDKLREKFIERGNENDFRALCMQINPNYQNVLDNLLRIYSHGKIPSNITSTSEFRDLLASVNTIDKLNKKNDKDETMISLGKSTESSIRERLEVAFRGLIERTLIPLGSPSDKLHAITESTDYSWIGELYPTVYTRDKRIFFLSVDKFIRGNSTLIEKTYTFYLNNIIDNSIIFIDEFDSSKDRILTQLIDQGLNNSIDFLPMFNQIHSSLKTRSFPSELTQVSKNQEKYLNANPKVQPPSGIINEFIRVMDDTYEKYNIQYSFKTAEDTNKETKRNFIFNDLQFHSVFSKDNYYIRIDTDHNAKQNWLKFSKNKPADKQPGIIDLLSSIKGCMSYFQNGCRFLAYNYKCLQDEKTGQIKDDFTLENAIESILREFHMSNYGKYLMPIILSEQSNRAEKHISDDNINQLLRLIDPSIYSKGFRYYDLIDNPNHNMQSEILLYDFHNSPERVLLSMAKRARVIGISATATIDTAIGNYDIEYLQEILQDDFYTMPNADKSRLTDNFANFTKDYENVNIHVEPVTFSEEISENLEEIFRCEALVKKYTEILADKFSPKQKYLCANFIRIIKSLKNFICNENVRSFLCLTNKLSKESKAIFDLSLVRSFAAEIIKENKLSHDASHLVESIISDDYDSKLENILTRLSNGEKIFVMSSYYTMGAGQNIQYKAPDDVNVIKVNQYTRGEMEKDFDCIYIEMPTHLVVNLNEKLNSDDLIRFIYQIEFLMYRGEISRDIGISYIKNAFSVFNGGTKKYTNTKSIYDTSSVNNHALRTLIQAIGRICRTGLKNKDIYIYVDDEIFKKCDFSKIDSRLLNPEFVALVNYAKGYKICRTPIDDSVTRLENIASTLSINGMRFIDQIRSNFTEETIAIYEEARLLTVMDISTNIDEISHNPLFNLIYLRAPYKISSYSYSQEGDYHNNIHVKFDDSLPQKVSFDELHLTDLFNIPGLKDYFISNGLITSYTPSYRMVTPVMFNNFAKGKIGEIVGSYIFEKYLSITLKNLPIEIYERFDYTLGDGIFIDFKLWKDAMIKDADEEKEAILRKLNECDGRRVLIINIIYDREAPITTSANEKIVEIPYLYRTDINSLDTDMIYKIVKKGYLR